MTDWRAETYGGVAMARRSRALDFPNVRNLLSVTAVEGVIDQAKSGRRDISADDKSKYLVVAPGDVVYNTMRMWQGVSGYSSLTGIVSPAYTVVRPSEGVVDGRFLAHLMKLPGNIDLYRRYSQGLVSDTWNLKFSALAALLLSVPPVEEQRRIAEILDTIDETIQATERVIAKLRVARFGVVADLLRPHSDWLDAAVGDVLQRIESGKSPDTPDRRPGAGEWGVLKVSAIHPVGFRPSESKVLRADQVRSQDEVKQGDVLITRANTPELVGMCCFVDSTPPHRQLSDKTLRLVPAPNVVPRYLALTLQSSAIRRQIERDGTGSSGSMKNISQAEIRSLQSSWPTVEQQISITETVKSLDLRLVEEAAVLAKLRSTRAGLAADLLSGRVRTVAP